MHAYAYDCRVGTRVKYVTAADSLEDRTIIPRGQSATVLEIVFSSQFFERDLNAEDADGNVLATLSVTRGRTENCTAPFIVNNGLILNFSDANAEASVTYRPDS